jgi:acetyl-CoA acetyltransferase
LKWVVENGLDAVGIRGVLNASAAIQAGVCNTVVIASAVAGPLIPFEDMPRSQQQAAQLEFVDPFGAGLVQRFALTARRHMHDYGTTSEQLAEVAATIRNFGHVNPEATMYGRGPYAGEDIMRSPMISEPLHRLDLGLTGHGGAALILTSESRARELRRDAVRILAGAMAVSEGPHAAPSLNSREGMLGAEAIRIAYRWAGIDVADIDLLSVYDATSFEVIRNIEMLGFCEPGEGGPFVENGALGLGGRIPTNTDGGLLSHGFATTAQLTMKVIEAVRQLRGQCADRQVDNAEVAVCTNGVASAHHVEALILGRA